MASRKIEIFSAGCGVCEDTIKLVNSLACPSCEVTVLDMQQSATANRAKELGIKSVPAVVIDGKLASCCEGRGPDLDSLKAAGLTAAMKAFLKSVGVFSSALVAFIPFAK